MILKFIVFYLIRIVTAKSQIPIGWLYINKILNDELIFFKFILHILLKCLGAIFDGNNYETELAFLTTIDRINYNERNFEIVPIINHISEYQSYVTQNMGEFIYN